MSTTGNSWTYPTSGMFYISSLYGSFVTVDTTSNNPSMFIWDHPVTGDVTIPYDALGVRHRTTESIHVGCEVNADSLSKIWEPDHQNDICVRIISGSIQAQPGELIHVEFITNDGAVVGGFYLNSGETINLGTTATKIFYIPRDNRLYIKVSGSKKPVTVTLNIYYTKASEGEAPKIQKKTEDGKVDSFIETLEEEEKQ